MDGRILAALRDAVMVDPEDLASHNALVDAWIDSGKSGFDARVDADTVREHARGLYVANAEALLGRCDHKGERLRRAVREAAYGGTPPRGVNAVIEVVKFGWHEPELVGRRPGRQVLSRTGYEVYRHSTLKILVGSQWVRRKWDQLSEGKRAKGVRS